MKEERIRKSETEGEESKKRKMNSGDEKEGECGGESESQESVMRGR